MSVRKKVVVVGGGYAGASIARALDDVADVTLVEPKDSFVHATGSLRAVVDPEWEDSVFHSYDNLLRNGQIIHDTAKRVTSTRVHLSSSAVLHADYIVLATGTGYPFPAKFLENQAWVARARLARMREELAKCTNVLIVGAGPVGLELAGELTSAMPDLGVTIVEQGADILPSENYESELRASLREQLTERGVQVLSGTKLGYLPPEDVGVYEPFTVHTIRGERIDAQMWFRCYGNDQKSDFLHGDLAVARKWGGDIRVGTDFAVEGFTNVFAIGDVTNVPETKRASSALAHAQIAAANIADLIAGRTPTGTYSPARELIVLPLGPTGGASQLLSDSGERQILGAEATSEIKGVDLMTGPIAAMLGNAVPEKAAPENAVSEKTSTE